MSSSADAVAAVTKTDWGRIVGALIRHTGDWTLAEDATQDAFAAALSRWDADGIPDNPAGWLMTVARNKAIDRLRARTSEREREREVTAMTNLRSEEREIEDDRLRLIFTCCHPALDLPARVALTLRTVAGLTVPEIAAAFLVTETTMAQRLVRARRRIEELQIPYRVPPAELLEERLGGVLTVLYLVFNEGYGGAGRPELTESAISMTGALAELMPGESEVRGLLALMLLQNSRRDARLDSRGYQLTLEEQDRLRWHRADIDRGLALLRALDGSGSYALQARIAACHARAATAADTDWGEIVRLYDQLLALAPSPVVEVNRAIAVGMLDSPAAGLAILDALVLPGYRWLPVAQSDLLRRAGRTEDAANRLREALEHPFPDSERAELLRRLAALEA